MIFLPFESIALNICILAYLKISSYQSKKKKRKEKEKGFHHFYKTVIQNESRQSENIKPAFIVKTGDYVVGQ